jgi:hypothetical protein
MKTLLSRPFAALLAAQLTLSVVGAAVAQPAPSSQVSEEARKHFKAGVAFLQDPDGARYEDAYREFKEAYRISPSWKILGNLGLASLKLERNAEAIDAYEKYLAQGGKEIESNERAQVERDLSALKAASATVTVQVTGTTGDVSITDQRSRSTGGAIQNFYTVTAGKPLTLKVQAGHHAFVAKSGDREAKREVDLTSDKPTELTFALDAPKTAAPPPPAAPPPATDTHPPPAEPRSSPLRTAGFVAIGVGGAAIVGGVITGLMAKGKQSDLESACPDKSHCPTANQSTADSAKSLATITNVLFIGGGVLAAGGGGLVIVGKPSEEASARRLVVSPGGPAAFGLTAAGTFLQHTYESTAKTPRTPRTPGTEAGGSHSPALLSVLSSGVLGVLAVQFSRRSSLAFVVERHVHGLHLQERVEAFGAEFAAHARLLVATERRGEVERIPVDGERARLDAPGDREAVGVVFRPDRAR